MDIPDPISWLIIALCILLHAFFSASETALSCCNRFKIQIKADDGSKTAKLLLRIINKFDRSLTTILIGNNIAAIVVIITRLSQPARFIPYHVSINIL